MEIKILIKTPKGFAASTERKLRPFLLGRSKAHKIMTSNADDQILWIVNAQAKDYIRIIKNVSVYKTLITNILNKKIVRKAAKLNKMQEAELDDMLYNQTEIDLIKDPEEFERIKKEFKEI